MRRLLTVCWLLCLVAIPSRAAEQSRCVALIIDSGPNGKYTQQLLEGLYDRGITVTFLLRGQKIPEHPELMEQILRDGHEIGCRGWDGQPLSRMSRRSIAQQIMDTQALLPDNIRLQFLFAPEGVSDGVRQVAEARRLSILGWSVNPEVWGPEAIPEQILRDGDIILLSDSNSHRVQAALDLINRLMEQNIQMVPAGHLAKLRRVSLKPGRIYTCFPPTIAQNG